MICLKQKKFMILWDSRTWDLAWSGTVFRKWHLNRRSSRSWPGTVKRRGNERKHAPGRRKSPASACKDPLVPALSSVLHPIWRLHHAHRLMRETRLQKQNREKSRNKPYLEQEGLVLKIAWEKENGPHKAGSSKCDHLYIIWVSAETCPQA